MRGTLLRFTRETTGGPADARQVENAEESLSLDPFP